MSSRARPQEGSAWDGIPEYWARSTSSQSSRNARIDRHPAPQEYIEHEGLSSAGGQWTTQRSGTLAATESQSGLRHRPPRTEFSFLGCPVQSDTVSPGASLTSLTRRRGPSSKARPEGFSQDDGFRPWTTQSAQSPERRCANAGTPHQHIDDSSHSSDTNTSDSSGGSRRTTPDARTRLSPDRGFRYLDGDGDRDSNSDSDGESEGATLGHRQKKVLLGDDGAGPLACRRYSRCAKVLHLDRYKKSDLGGHADLDASVEDDMVSEHRTSASRSSSQGPNVGTAPKSSAGDVAGGDDFTVESGTTERICR